MSGNYCAKTSTGVSNPWINIGTMMGPCNEHLLLIWKRNYYQFELDTLNREGQTKVFGLFSSVSKDPTYNKAVNEVVLSLDDVNDKLKTFENSADIEHSIADGIELGTKIIKFLEKEIEYFGTIKCGTGIADTLAEDVEHYKSGINQLESAAQYSKKARKIKMRSILILVAIATALLLDLVLVGCGVRALYNRGDLSYFDGFSVLVLICNVVWFIKPYIFKKVE